MSESQKYSDLRISRRTVLQLPFVAGLIAACGTRKEPTPAPTPPESAKPEVLKEHKGYYVEGNTIYNPDGTPHIFVGMSRPSLEWSLTGENMTPELFKQMKDWGINVIRLPINQQYWLDQQKGKEYQAMVSNDVTTINELGMDAILDLHWSDKNNPSEKAGQQKMPDERSKEMWREAATQYGKNRHVLFEAYNEPHDVNPDTWLNGGDTGDGYRAVGMQEIAETIRSTGAENLIVINGLDWGYDHRGLQRVKGENIVYGAHPYSADHKDEPHEWDEGFGFLIPEVPVMLTEYGETDDCDGKLNETIVRYADEHKISRVAWAYYPQSNYPAECGFPGLIYQEDNGEILPTAAGQAELKDIQRFKNDPLRQTK